PLRMAPGRDHLELGRQPREGELEAHLVVALAGGAVSDRVGPLGARDFDLALGDRRARDRGAQQVVALVHRVGAQHREDEVARELLAQVLEIEFARARPERLFFESSDLLGLANVSAVRHHLASVAVANPPQDDRSIEPAGVGEYHFAYAGSRHGAILGNSAARLKWGRPRPG